MALLMTPLHELAVMIGGLLQPNFKLVKALIENDNGITLAVTAVGPWSCPLVPLTDGSGGRFVGATYVSLFIE